MKKRVQASASKSMDLKNLFSARSNTDKIHTSIISEFPHSLTFAKRFHEVLTVPENYLQDTAIFKLAAYVDLSMWNQRLRQIMEDYMPSGYQCDLRDIIKLKWANIASMMNPLESDAPAEWVEAYCIHPFFVPDSSFGYLVIYEVWGHLRYIFLAEARLHYLAEANKEKAVAFATEKVQRCLQTLCIDELRATFDDTRSRYERNPQVKAGSLEDVPISGPELCCGAVLFNNQWLMTQLPGIVWALFSISNIHYLSTKQRNLIQSSPVRHANPLMLRTATPPDCGDLMRIHGPDFAAILNSLECKDATESNETVTKKRKSLAYNEAAVENAQTVLDLVCARLNEWELDSESQVTYNFSLEAIEEEVIKNHQSMINHAAKDADAVSVGFLSTYKEKFKTVLHKYVTLHPVHRFNSTTSESAFARTNALAVSEELKALPLFGILRVNDIWTATRTKGWLDSLATDCAAKAMVRALHPIARFGDKEAVIRSPEYIESLRLFKEFAGSDTSDRKKLTDYLTKQRMSLPSQVTQLMKERISDEARKFKQACETLYTAALEPVTLWFKRYNDVALAINSERKQEQINAKLSKDILRMSVDLLDEECFLGNKYVSDESFNHLKKLKTVIVEELGVDARMFEKFYLDESTSYVDQKAISVIPELKAIQVACSIGTERKVADPVHAWLYKHTSPTTVTHLCEKLSQAMVPIKPVVDESSFVVSNQLPSMRPMEVREYVLYLLAHLAHVSVLPPS
jgi:hypothetical protein